MHPLAPPHTYLKLFITSEHCEVPELDLNSADLRDRTVRSPFRCVCFPSVQVDVRKWYKRAAVKTWEQPLSQLYLDRGRRKQQESLNKNDINPKKSISTHHLTALFKKSVSFVRWYVANSPPRTRIVVSKRFTSLSWATTMSSFTHRLASSNSSFNPINHMVSNESTRVRPRLNHSLLVFVTGLSSSLPQAYSLYAFHACLNAAVTAPCRSVWRETSGGPRSIPPKLPERLLPPTEGSPWPV